MPPKKIVSNFWTVQANYRRIKEEVKQIVQEELERIKNDPVLCKLNAIKFQFFETWLRSHGNLKSQAGDVIDKIVKTV